jgi:predicted RNA-binding Zn ribbon-like protein
MPPAPGERAHPALALANSRHNAPAGPIDELASPATMGAWLAAHDFARATGDARDDEGALAAMRELRRAVRELLLARVEGRVADPAAVAAVNEAAFAAPAAPRLTWTDSPRTTRDFRDAGGPARARAVVAADAIDLVTGPAHADLRACAAPGCVRLLLKDHPRREWCSTRCGDRVRAARYYRRRKAASAADPGR